MKIQGTRYKVQKNIRIALFLYLATCILYLTACGFTPVYGTYSATNTIAVESQLTQIKIANIPNREGLFLRNILIDSFYKDGRPENTNFTLNIAPIQETARRLDITIDSDATRGQLILTTTMSLKDNQSSEIILERTLRSIASYNILDSEFTNRISEQNARENSLKDLARQITEQLSFHFNQNS